MSLKYQAFNRKFGYPADTINNFIACHLKLYMITPNTTYHCTGFWKFPCQRSIFLFINCLLISACAVNKSPEVPVAEKDSSQAITTPAANPDQDSAKITEACKAINVKVRNLTGRKINIESVDFYDYSNQRWHSASIEKATVSRGKGWNYNLELKTFSGNQTRAKISYLVNPKAKSGKAEAILKTGETKSKYCTNKTRFFKSVR